MPGTEDFRKCPPFTAVFEDIDDGVKEPAIIDFYISSLFRKKVNYFFSAVPALISYPQYIIFP
jgi:hypothetical protein